MLSLLRLVLRTCLSAALLTPLLPAQAGLVLHTTESSYRSAVGASVAAVDFAGDPQASVSGTGFSMDVFFGTCADPAQTGSCFTTVFQAGDAITDTGSLQSPNGVGSLVWRVNRGDVFALGFHYFGGRLQQLQLVDLALGLQGLDTSAADGFIGLVSDTPLYGGIFISAMTSDGRERLFLDDFRLDELPDPASRELPEPASAALAVLGLLLAAVAGRAAPQARRPA